MECGRWQGFSERKGKPRLADKHIHQEDRKEIDANNRAVTVIPVVEEDLGRRIIGRWSKYQSTGEAMENRRFSTSRSFGPPSLHCALDISPIRALPA
jgi:hypothetical protein